MLRAALIGVVCWLLALPLAAQQQDSPAPAGQPSQSGSGGNQNNPKAQPPKKSAAEANPFPEEQSEAAAHQPDANQAQTPEKPGAPPATDQNPFPEEKAEKAAKQTDAARQGSSGDSDYSSSRSELKGLKLPKENDSRIADGAGGTVLSPELGRKDVQIGEFYLHQGDARGAYDRFSEAMKVDPDNANAVFGFAEAARRLNRRTEAIQNYQLYLTALPDGPHAKDARKGLKDLGIEPES